MITLRGLQKISLNDWYAGKHWTKRKNVKDIYKAILRPYKDSFNKIGKYDVEYTFYFASMPLDASNCVAMAKMIEDVLFESDSFKIVRSVTYRSRKDSDQRVEINVRESE